MDLVLPDAAPTEEERAAVDEVVGPEGDTAVTVRARIGGHAARARRPLLLPALVALVDRVGWVSPGGLTYIARRLDVAPADVYGVGTFYALLPFRERTGTVAHVCEDLACRLDGGADRRRAELAADGSTTVVASPCLGLCERAPAALVVTPGAPPRHRVVAEPERPARGVGPGMPLLLRRVGVVDPASIDDYRAHGGYRALRRALELGPVGVIAEVTESGLTGRGGAAFPTGRKWDAVARQPARPHHLVANADESEPGTFKDRVLMEGDPFAVVESMTIAALATGCERGWIYLRGEYAAARTALEGAIRAARARGYLGPDVMGSGQRVELEVFRGAGAYICGEETAIFNSIEGHRGEPRNKPPFPVEAGLFGRPTVVNNIETLVNVLPVLTEGAAAFRRRGTADSPGSKLFCVSGAVADPGVIEVPFGASVRELITAAGGLRPGRQVQAVLLGGAAGSFVGPDQLDLPLTGEATRAAGTTVGSGVVLVLDDDADLVDQVRRIAAFFRDESCGQCVPCRVGTVRQEEALARLASGGTDRRRDLALLADVGRAMRDASICGLGQTAWNAVESAVLRLGVFGAAQDAGGSPPARTGSERS